MSFLTKSELEKFGRAFENIFECEFLGFDDSEKKIELKFQTTESMMCCINRIKKDRVGKFLRFNSKIINEKSILTIDPR